jgi:hypothetical protein
MLAKFAVAEIFGQIYGRLNVDTNQCQAIYDSSRPQMKGIAIPGISQLGTRSRQKATDENGIGVVRILSRPVNASTSWLRAAKRVSKK